MKSFGNSGDYSPLNEKGFTVFAVGVSCRVCLRPSRKIWTRNSSPELRLFKWRCQLWGRALKDLISVIPLCCWLRGPPSEGYAHHDCHDAVSDVM